MSVLLHPQVVHFPIALLLTSLLFDVLYLSQKQPAYRTMALWLVGLGVLSIPVVIGLGFVDYNRAVREGVGTAFVDRHRGHSLLAYIASALFAVSLVIRWRRPGAAGLAFLVSVVGGAALAVAGFLGGELRGVM